MRIGGNPSCGHLSFIQVFERYFRVFLVSGVLLVFFGSVFRISGVFGAISKVLFLFSSGYGFDLFSLAWVSFLILWPHLSCIFPLCRYDFVRSCEYSIYYLQ